MGEKNYNVDYETRQKPTVYQGMGYKGNFQPQIVDPETGQTLVYDAETGTWKNQDNEIVRNGYYEDMVVGTAEQLVSEKNVSASGVQRFMPIAYLADSVPGNRIANKVVGGSIAWNQIVHNGDFNEASRWWVRVGGTNFDFTKGRYKYRANNEYTGLTQIFDHATERIDHIFYFTIDVCSSNPNGQIGFGSWVTLNRERRIIQILTKKTSQSNSIIIYYRGNVGDEVELRNINLFDLTQMFGETVADYIYENQDTLWITQWFDTMFPEPYYDTNIGELKSVESLSSIDCTGINQWDEEWETGVYDGETGVPAETDSEIRSKNFIRVYPGTTMYLYSNSNVTVLFYDKGKNLTDSSFSIMQDSITIPEDCYYLKICTEDGYGDQYKNDICLSYVFDGEEIDHYEPYKKHSYELDNSITLRGVPTLDENDNIVYDGDMYYSNGIVERRFGTITFDGTESWTVGPATGLDDRNVAISNIVLPNSISRSNSLIGNYVLAHESASGFPLPFSAYINPANKLVIGLPLSINSEEDWLSYLQNEPLTIVYELETPVRELAEPYTNPQVIDKYGTMEYVSTGIVPPGYDSQLMVDMRDKLDRLPAIAGSDGTYAITQTDGEMALTPYPIPMPPIDDGDGTYTLECVITDGVPSYVWLAEPAAD